MELKKNHSKNYSLVLLFLILTLISLGSVLAVDRLTFITGGNLTNQGNFSTINETAVGSDTAQGGNVTYMNISTTAATVKWQGYYGSVAANLLIGSSASGSTLSGGLATLYSWGAIQTDQVKTVFATSSSTFDWSALTAASAANVNTLDTQLGWLSSDTDSANSTFDDDVDIQIARVNVRAAQLNSYMNPITAFDSSVLVSGLYTTGIFTDGGTLVSLDDFAFGGDVNHSGLRAGNAVVRNKAFDNNTAVDYELLVPTNGTNIADGTRGVNTYYFWLDIE